MAFGSPRHPRLCWRRLCHCVSRIGVPRGMLPSTSPLLSRAANVARRTEFPARWNQRRDRRLKRRGNAVADKSKESIMLGWAITFLIVALVAALFGFGGIAAAVDIARIIFFVAIVLFLISAAVALV